MARPWQQVPCTRLEAQGRVVVDFRYPEETDVWLEYNKRYRPECALFVDDKIAHKGEFASLEEAAESLTKLRARPSKRLLP